MAPPIDDGTLAQLLLGKLPPEQAEPLLAAVADSPRVEEVARKIGAGDTLLEALNAQSTHCDLAPDPGTEALVNRLRRLLDADPSSVTGDEEGIALAPGKSCALPFLAAAQQADELGRLGNYRVLKVLGQGGMGIVLLAEDPKLRRQVAIKAMKPEFAASEQAKERFLREARATAQIEHEHVIAVHQVGEERGVPFLVMPLLRGETLDERLQRERRPPLAEALRIGREIAEGLAAAHERGLIHRDIKPANIWLEGERARVRVLDFGLARGGEGDASLTQSGQVVGTPSYMAPEQANSEAVDARCDLFSLGCVLYQLTVGEKAFTGGSIMNILHSLATHNPVPPAARNSAVPAELSALVMRLLSKRREGRPAKARQVADELAALEERLKHPLAVPMAQPVGDTEVGLSNPWADIDEGVNEESASEQASAPRVSGQAKEGSKLEGFTAPRSPRTLRTALLAAGLLAAIAVVLFATGVIRIETPKGTLVIVGADDDVEVVITINGAIIKEKTKLGELREYALKVGDGYQIELAEQKEGLRLKTDSFTITRGEKTTVKVYLEKRPRPEPIAAVPVAKGTSDREITEWARALGAGIILDSGPLLPTDALPAAPFRVVGLDFAKVKGLRDEHLKPLAGLEKLTRLSLDNQWITDSALEQIPTSFKGLTRLHLAGTRVTATGVKKLSQALPDCTIDSDHGIFGDREREVAKWVIQNGGSVAIAPHTPHLNDLQGLPIKMVERLPREPFTLTAIRTTERVDTPGVTDTDLDRLRGLKGLAAILLPRSELTDAGVAKLVGMPEIKDVWFMYLSGHRVTEKGIASLERLPKLRTLWLHSCRTTLDAVLRETASFPALECMGTIHMSGLTDGLKSWAGRRLEELHFSDAGFGAEPAAAFAHLRKLASIERLSLCAVDDKSLAELKYVPTLRHLRVHQSDRVTDAGLEHLAKMPWLVRIDVDSNQLTLGAVKKLAAALPDATVGARGSGFPPRNANDRKVAEWVLKNGGKVDLWYEGPARKDIADPQQLPAQPFRISVINLNTTQGAALLDDEALKNLRPISVLEHGLDLGGQPITDAGLEQIAIACPWRHLVDHLVLANTKATDTSLDGIAAMKALLFLDLRGTKVTAEGVKKLAAALPDCRIDSDHGTFGPTKPKQ